jgi:hypothetical protein
MCRKVLQSLTSIARFSDYNPLGMLLQCALNCASGRCVVIYKKNPKQNRLTPDTR